jgi:leader peptidase (prepilin peptidase)/N-methyltransferase
MTSESFSDRRFESQDELSPRLNLPLLLAGTTIIASVSFLCLAWPAAIASIFLGVLMIIGADIDARCFLLPDFVTLGGCIAAMAAAALLARDDPFWALAEAGLRAICVAGSFELLRRIYLRKRGCEGLGLGDVKLAAAIGAWLPFEFVPSCISLAAGAALATVGVAHLRGATIGADMKLPFGAFLCPALWLTFFASVLPT